jgi:DNA-binding MarR family transcriptional regulator
MARSFAVYLEFLETGDWLRQEMERHLEAFDMTLMEFRILELLNRGEPMYAEALSSKLHCSPGNVKCVLDRMVRRGWVSKEWSHAKYKVARRYRFRKMESRPRKGRLVLVLKLTPGGEKVIVNVLPKHAKIVRAKMRVLHGAEQQTLAHLCEKWRAGDVMKFVKEMMWEDVVETSMERESKVRG